MSSPPGRAPPGFTGAVLCGGASRRMGRDKALLVVDGIPMAARVAAELRAAGAHPVFAVGGDLAALGAAGLDGVPDEGGTGRGPLAGIATAIRHGSDLTLVLGCDLLAPSAAAMRATVERLAADDHADAAVPVVGGRRQWAHAAWRGAALPALEGALGRGARAVHRAAAALRVVEVPGIDPRALVDADTPADLDQQGPGPVRPQ